MRKFSLFIVAVIMIFSLLLLKAPQNVFAVGSEGWILPSGAVFTNVNLDTDAQFAPIWLQQLSEGIMITAPTKICYPFRGGQFHWVPKVMQLSGKKWTPLATTQDYLYGSEGMLYACAAPAGAGTFALFGYYNGPAEGQINGGSCTGALSVSEWTVNSEPYFTGLSLQNLKAVGINWTGCTNAVGLGWGYRSCIDGNCDQYDDATIGISAVTYPYPQDLTETIIGGSSMGIFPQGSQTCEFKPYVRLFDASGKTLDIIYDLEFPDMCLS